MRVAAATGVDVRLAPDDAPEVASLRDEVTGARPNTLLETRTLAGPSLPSDAPTAAAVANALAVAVGYQPIASWWTVTRDEATGFLVRLLSRDMAYGDPIMDDATAGALARRFLARFAADGVYLTNRNDVVARSYGCSPVAPATFDGGVVAVGGGCAGMLWMQDED